MQSAALSLPSCLLGSLCSRAAPSAGTTALEQGHAAADIVKAMTGAPGSTSELRGPQKSNKIMPLPNTTHGATASQPHGPGAHAPYDVAAISCDAARQHQPFTVPASAASADAARNLPGREASPVVGGAMPGCAPPGMSAIAGDAAAVLWTSPATSPTSLMDTGGLAGPAPAGQSQPTPGLILEPQRPASEPAPQPLLWDHSCSTNSSSSAALVAHQHGASGGSGGLLACTPHLLGVGGAAAATPGPEPAHGHGSGYWTSLGSAAAGAPASGGSQLMANEWTLDDSTVEHWAEKVGFGW